MTGQRVFIHTLPLFICGPGERHARGAREARCPDERCAVVLLSRLLSRLRCRAAQLCCCHLHEHPGVFGHQQPAAAR